MGLLSRIFSSDTDTDEDDVYDEPKERTETETMDVYCTYTDYRVEIQYADRTRTEYVTHYQTHENHIELYDAEPRLKSHYMHNYNGPHDEKPILCMNRGEPLIISLPNVEDIDISKNNELVAVVEDVEYEQVYRQYKEDGTWQESYSRVGELPDEYDVTTWLKSEWDAECGD